jgi:hypothetical protein
MLSHHTTPNLQYTITTLSKANPRLELPRFTAKPLLALLIWRFALGVVFEWKWIFNYASPPTTILTLTNLYTLCQ